MPRVLLPFVVFAVLLPLFTVVDPSFAQDSAPPTPRLAFPYVPNGEHYADTGPWYGTIILQNPEAAPLTVELRTTSGTLLRTVALDPHASTIVSAEQLFGACRRYRTVIRKHQPDGIDTVFLPTISLSVDRVEIPGFQVGIDYTWQVLGAELQIDWSLPGWEPTGEYEVVVVDCPDGQPVLIALLDPPAALMADASACVSRTRAIELAAVKGVVDSADAVRLPEGLGPITVVEVRYGPRYWASLGLGDPTAVDTSGRWQATVSAGAVTIHWGTLSGDDDGGIPPGARYSVIVHAQETMCREPRLSAMLLLTAGAPTAPDGSTTGAAIVSSLPAAMFSQLSSQAVLPLIQRHNGWTTVLHLAHRGSMTCPLQVALRDGRGELRWSSTRSLAPGEMWHLDLRTLDLPADFIGTAWLLSSCGPLASADRIKPSHKLALTNSAVDPDHTPGELLLPIVYSNHNGWNTGLAITNLSRNQVTVDLAFHNPSGALVRSERRTLAPTEQTILYRPDLPSGLPGQTPLTPVDGEQLSGHVLQLFSLQVRATGPVAVIGDTVKYVTNAGRALTLPATPAVPAGVSLLLPLMHVAVPAESGDVTGITVANATLSQAPTTVEIWPTAAPAPLRLTIPLGPRGLGVLYLPTQFPNLNRLSGTAVLWVEAGAAAAAGTHVNAAILGDGATATPLTAGWAAPILGISLLPTWDAQGPGSQPDIGLTAVGLPGTPLIVELIDGNADVDSDPACSSGSPVRSLGSGNITVSLFVCALDPVAPPTFTVRLWWDRGTTPGALDPGDELLVEQQVALPR
ncbi:hypothetical protein NET03_02940 [Thermomicrobium sp. CFH 73360]|uniref:hypothetical protein n=1 Tax=Thermomicrobium sp. CFH 73360 TaxID=2951987 RepID=UPI0020769DDF|nr:hypothetical protein [Thermomicrobium sp. CFH 73360]MCM8745479.1 hypothetical protein [Thermomicrobium sp. CFH 73360]